MKRLKFPAPYFGGKSRVAPLIWDRLGDVDNYIEAFAGSAAVLLARPYPPRIETINDANCFVSNVWRALAADPEAVAEHADWIVSETDLHARHRWLVKSETSAEFRKRMKADPEYYDPKIAGWWLWGACAWIGSGWCDDSQYERHRNAPPFTAGGDHHYGLGVHAKGPGPAEDAKRLTGGRTGDEYYDGLGVHADKIEGPAEETKGLWQQTPQLADAYSRGRGVHGNDTAGTCAARRAWLIDWFGRLQDRLRTVRVCCGHWRRVCDSPSVTTRLGVTGLFLDPPYRHTLANGEQNRTKHIYANDKHQDVNALCDEVLAYCLERGSDPLMRIVLAGYADEGFEPLEAAGWSVIEWRSSGGYGNRSAKGKANAARERLWCSPHTLDPEANHYPLFDALGGREGR